MKITCQLSLIPVYLIFEGLGWGGGGGGGGLNRAREVNKFIASKMGVIREGGLVKEKRAGGRGYYRIYGRIKGAVSRRNSVYYYILPDTRYET